MRHVASFWIAALLWTSVAGAADPAPPPGRPAVAQSRAERDWHERGRRVYNFRCYYCHGYSGDARTLAGTYLTPRPRNFAALDPGGTDRARMTRIIADGSPGTAMKGFRNVIDDTDIRAVADFVFREFVVDKAPNTRYHTAGNGWPRHERYRIAFPFATGEIALDTPPGRLDPAQRAGRKLYLEACVSCHDRARVTDEGPVWEVRPGPQSRATLITTGFVRVTGYADHRLAPAPRVAGLDTAGKTGERVFQENCSYCHARDGSGRNWIGQFLTPRVQDLRDTLGAPGMTPARVREIIRDGVPDTPMPAWRSVLTAAQIDGVVRYMERAFPPAPRPADRAPSNRL